MWPVLEINPLSIASFINIFSLSIGCLFIVYCFFCCAKLYSLIRSHLFIFVFISITLGDESKKNLAVIYIKEYSAYVFLWEFYIVSSLTFRSLIHFCLFSHTVLENVLISFFHNQFSQHHLLNRTDWLFFFVYSCLLKIYKYLYQKTNNKKKTQSKNGWKI